jgi:acyl CoA:acetate/3-ketoacid CoA transferase alpha subunit/acyl CoA:acetate/3-ketoacid CoA transferase beta subunit
MLTTNGSPAEFADRSQSKVMPVSAAVRSFVRPGAHLHFGYGGGRPNAAVAEIIRQFAGTEPRFRISAHGFVNTQHALVAAGLVERLIVAFAGENFPSPRPNPILQRAIKTGSVQIENWSLWTLTARLMAGALGLSSFPVRSLDGSSLATEHAGKAYQELRAAGETEPVLAVRAMRPDVVLVQALAADSAGNVILAPPYGEAAWGSLAARVGTIACVEALVDTDFIRDHNTLPMIPAHAVRAVCKVPFGSHPYGIYGAGLPGVTNCVDDATFMAELRVASRSAAEMAEWIQEWITGVADHEEYLERLGSNRLRTLTAAPGRAVADTPVAESDRSARDITSQERMILAAARVLRERVTAAGHDIVLAGIGYAHLAAWTAVQRLHEAGGDVQLAAELGMSGFVPQPGDPYLFAARNFPTCRQLTDVLGVLGRDVAGPAASCIGILGAGQVDMHGNINSTYSADGDFLVGSGGANDVASTADDVIAVVNQSASRLVESVPYITAPGRRVSAIVTSAGVFERDGGQYVLTRFFAPAGSDRESLLGEIRRQTGWELVISPTCQPEPEPERADLARLRAYDPAQIFVGR